MTFAVIPPEGGDSSWNGQLPVNIEGAKLRYNVGQFSTCSVHVVATADLTTFRASVLRSNDPNTTAALETTPAISLAANEMSEAIDCSGFHYLWVTLGTAQGADGYARIFVIGKAP